MSSGIFSMLSFYYNDPEYFNLSEEEKNNLDFVDKCIYSENKNINNASFNIMMLPIEMSNNPDKYEPEEIHKKFNMIKKDLSNEEKIVIDRFLIACINSIGIYSEEAKNERKLKKERNDKKWQK